MRFRPVYIEIIGVHRSVVAGSEALLQRELFDFRIVRNENRAEYFLSKDSFALHPAVRVAVAIQRALGDSPDSSERRWREYPRKPLNLVVLDRFGSTALRSAPALHHSEVDL